MKPVIFFDLDGVLAQFVRGALDFHGATLPVKDIRWAFPTQIGFKDENDPDFWRPLGYDFWANLPVHDDGVELLRHAETLVPPERIGFLTSPTKEPGCVDGKRDWVARHFPEYSSRLYTGKNKQLFAGPTKILIDDHDTNIDAFLAAGGRTVQPARPWNRWRQYCSDDGAFPVDITKTAIEICVTLCERAATPSGIPCYA